MKGSHYEMRFSGSGGQGIMLMGDVMAQAAGCFENKEIVLTKSYGPESRGGACRSELIVDAEPINYPTVVAPDFVLTMTQLACDKYSGDIAEGGALLVDEELVTEYPANTTVFALPLTRIAKEQTGKEITANMVALGAIAVLGKCASVESVRSAVMGRFPEALLKINETAFEAGVSAARALLE